MIPKIPDHIERLIPYQPGKPIEELERELGISGSIKLASNENPVGPSPAVVEAIMQNLPKINLYPDGDCFYLKAALAAHLGVTRDQLIVGNGSNEVIELVLHTFLGPGEETVSAAGAFVVYDLATRSMGGHAVQVPMKRHAHDLAAMARAVTDRTKVAFVANPNNPTGTASGAGEFSRFLDDIPDGVLVVVDEAYYEYVDLKSYPDTLRMLADGRDNLVVLRTFSKAYGLAGLRIGFGVAAPAVVGAVNKVRQPFNVNLLAQVAALAALADQEHVRRVVSLCRRERRRMEREFADRGLEYVPTQANFILVRVGARAREVYESLLARGVIVRPVGGYGYPDWLRVTVGLPEENDRFLRELAALTALMPNKNGRCRR